MVIAADRPFGPLPITTASYSVREKGMRFGEQSHIPSFWNACSPINNRLWPSSYRDCHILLTEFPWSTLSSERRRYFLQIIAITIAQSALQQFACGGVWKFFDENIGVGKLPFRKAFSQK